jgi:hypothetical protein
MSHWPPRIVGLSSTAEGALHVEWEVDSFFPDSEAPDETWVAFGLALTQVTDATEIDIPGSVLAPFAGTTVGGAVTFKWIGPPDDLKGSPFYVSVGSGGHIDPPSSPLAPVRGLRASPFWDFVRLDWDALDAWAVYVDVLRDGPGGLIHLDRITAHSGGPLSDTDGRVQPVSRYTYTVRTLDPTGASADASVQVQTPAPPPAPAPSRWHGPETIGFADVIPRPTAVSWGPTRIDLFWYSTMSKKIVHKWQNDGSAWFQEELNLPPLEHVFGIAASTLGQNHLELLYTRGDTVWHTWWNGSMWAEEQDITIFNCGSYRG